MTHLYKFSIPDSSKNSTFILKNSAKNSIFASIFDLILDSRSSNSTSIFQFCDSDSALTRLMLQSFDIRLDDEPQVGTPLRRYLTSVGLFTIFSLTQNTLIIDYMILFSHHVVPFRYLDGVGPFNQFSISNHVESYIVGSRGASQLGDSLLGIPLGYKAN